MVSSCLLADAHEGLKAARKSVFPSVPWQRCQFHLQTKRAKLCAQAGHESHRWRMTFAVSFDAKTPDEAKRHIELLCQEV